MRVLQTLCVIHDDKEILLGMKKRGLGAGRWNGFGGKVAENETIEEAAKRELEEETGLQAGKLTKRALFVFKGVIAEDIEVHVFKAENFAGEPVETEEMKPKWFKINEIPYEDMWPDDKHWLPLFIKGENLKGTFVFDGDNVLNMSLEETELSFT